MRLIQIELCPFAGFQQRTVDFKPGLNVVLGENEAGKSTLVNAIKSVLFENTQQIKREFTPFAEKFIPRGKGDHAKVNLTFSVGNDVYSLSKTWGAGKSASLKLNGGASWNDDSAVQEQLNELLQLHRGSWETILFADQNTLFKTASSIEASAQNINRIPTLKNMQAGIPGDIPADDLLRDLEALMVDYNGQWDFFMDGPRDNRGITNPWIKNAGLIVKSYYELETVRKDYEELIGLEIALEKINESLKTQSANIENKQTQFKTLDDLKEVYNNATRLQLTKNDLETALSPMMNAVQNWDAKTKNQASLGTSIAEMKVEMEKNTEEGKRARRINDTRVNLGYYKDILDLDAKIAEIKKVLQANGNINKADEALIQSHQTNINQLEVELKAQKLQATFSADTEVSFLVTNGLEPTSTVSVSQGNSADIDITAQVTIAQNDWKITVKSALKPIDQLLAQMEENRLALQALLTKNNLASWADFERNILVNQTNNEQLRVLENNRTQTLKKTNTTIEALQAIQAEIGAMPTTRTLEELLEMHNTLNDKLKKAEKTLEEDQALLLQWATEYTDQTKLLWAVSQKTIALEEIKSKMSESPVLPAEYKDYQAFLDHLNQLQHSINDESQQIAQLRENRATIQGKLENYTTDAISLQADLDLAERKFERRKLEYTALEMAERTLKTVIAQQDQNPFEAFETETAAMFAQITDNRYTQLLRGGEAPESVIFNNQQIPVNLLSDGTAGALGLAIRFAYAKQYLANMDGFVVLDDPFTDFDISRRKAASKFLQDFAGQKQVFVMTCHSEHAADLGGHRIELKRTT
ncbi:MAG: AAA family ATPase [Bacteroidota bacterium]